MAQPQNYTDRLNTIFYASIGLPMVLFCWVYLPRMEILSWDQPHSVALPLWLLYIIGMVVVVGVFWYVFKLRAQLKTVPAETDIERKFSFFADQWKKGYLVTAVGCVIAALLLLMLQHTFFVVVYALLLFFISLYRPSPNRWEKDMNWSEEQREMFDRPRQLFKSFKENQQKNG